MWRWIFYFGPAIQWGILGKIASKFLSEFWWQLVSAKFSASFVQASGPPVKFTPKTSKNRRHSSPISLLEPKNVSHRFSAYGGDKDRTPKFFTPIFCLRGKTKKRVPKESLKVSNPEPPERRKNAPWARENRCHLSNWRFNPENGCIFWAPKGLFADAVCAQMVQNKAFWPRFTFSQEAKTWKEKSLFLQC